MIMILIIMIPKNMILIIDHNRHRYDHLHLRFVDVNHSVSAEVCSSIFEVVQVNWAYKELQVQCQEVKKEYVLLRMIMILVMRMC